MNIVVVGTGYVGLSLAVLLSQHNHVTAIDIVQDKVDKINNRRSSIQDEYIEKYLSEKDIEEADSNATVVVKSTVPVGFTKDLRTRSKCEHILFSPEFLRESKALYDNLYTSRIIVGITEDTEEEKEKAN